MGDLWIYLDHDCWFLCLVDLCICAKFAELIGFTNHVSCCWLFVDYIPGVFVFVLEGLYLWSWVVLMEDMDWPLCLLRTGTWAGIVSILYKMWFLKLTLAYGIGRRDSDNSASAIPFWPAETTGNINKVMVNYGLINIVLIDHMWGGAEVVTLMFFVVIVAGFCKFFEFFVVCYYP